MARAGRFDSLADRTRRFCYLPERCRYAINVLVLGEEIGQLVGEIGFAEWTTDGRLRQARFLGLRDDKRPEEVVRERAS